MFKRILYTSFVDISVPYGPGVNERGFLKDMLQRYGDNLHAAIPKPSRGMPTELTTLKSTNMTMFGSSRNLAGWLQARTCGAISLWNAIRRFNPDIIVIRSGALAFSQMLVLALTKVPYVIKTAGDGRHAHFYKKSRFSRLLRPVDQAMQKRIFKNSSCIDVVSDIQKDRLSSLYPDLKELIYAIDNGADTVSFDPDNYPHARQSLGFEYDDIVIGYVGSAPMRRGGKEVIDVIAALASKLQVKGLIVGDSGEAEECREYAKNMGVADLVIVYGEADYSMVPSLMSVVDCGLSIRRAEERGASELKVRQYLASGVCVVGTVGGNDFLRGHEFARVVETEETDQVVAAVVSLIAVGSAAVSALGEKARSFALAELTISLRNDKRLQYWAEHIGNNEP